VFGKASAATQITAAAAAMSRNRAAKPPVYACRIAISGTTAALTPSERTNCTA